MHKLLENIKNFGYKVPEDPEQLLYDFYFMAGYMPSEHEDKVLDFVFKEALKDCTVALQDEMLKALYWSLCAEIRHIWSESVLRPSRKDTFASSNLPDDVRQFLTLYAKAGAIYGSDLVDTLQPDRKPELLKKSRALKHPMFKGLVGRKGISGRQGDYGQSFLAVEKARQSMGLSKLEAVKILEQLYGDVEWSGSYGGKAWASIAQAYIKLARADSTPERMVYIDHAYDLQHNTGSVFTKVKGYYKNGSLEWLARGLDWKRDATDLRGYYDRVSPGMKPVVAWIAKNQHDITMEDYVDPEVAARVAAEEQRAKTQALLDDIEVSFKLGSFKFAELPILLRVAYVHTIDRSELYKYLEAQFPGLQVAENKELEDKYALTTSEANKACMLNYSTEANVWLLYKTTEGFCIEWHESMPLATKRLSILGQPAPTQVYEDVHVALLMKLLVAPPKKPSTSTKQLPVKSSTSTKQLPAKYYIDIKGMRKSKVEELIKALEILDPALKWVSGEKLSDWLPSSSSVRIIKSDATTAKLGVVTRSAASYSKDFGTAGSEELKADAIIAKAKALDEPADAEVPELFIGDTTTQQPPQKILNLTENTIETADSVFTPGRLPDTTLIYKATPASGQSLNRGDLVQLYIARGKAPKFGWGSVSNGMVGVILEATRPGVAKTSEHVVAVKFPVHAHWAGLADELRLLSPVDFPEALAMWNRSKETRSSKAEEPTPNNSLPEKFYASTIGLDKQTVKLLLEKLEKLRPELRWVAGQRPSEFIPEKAAYIGDAGRGLSYSVVDADTYISANAVEISAEDLITGKYDKAPAAKASPEPSGTAGVDSYSIPLFYMDLEGLDRKKRLTVLGYLQKLYPALRWVSGVLPTSFVTPLRYIGTSSAKGNPLRLTHSDDLANIMIDKKSSLQREELTVRQLVRLYNSKRRKTPDTTDYKGGSAVNESRDFHEFFKYSEAVTMAQVGGKLLANAPHFAKNMSLIQDFRILDLPDGIKTADDLLFNLATDRQRGRVLSDNIVNQIKNLQAKHGNLRAGISAWLKANPDARTILEELLQQGVTATGISKADVGAVRKTGSAAQLQAAARR